MDYAIEYFCVSHRGKVRRVNQDNFFCLNTYMPSSNNGSEKMLSGTVSAKDSPRFAIFDGMGGEECGEMAAYIASKKMAEFPFVKKTEQELSAFCRAANAEICTFAAENGLYSTGTTAAILQCSREAVQLCNVGDSRIFRWSSGVLKQISFDHVAAAPPGRKPPLTQNLGIPEDEMIISPYTVSSAYRSGDIYLICSDGLTDMVSEEEIEAVLRTCPKDRTAGILLQKALDNGGRDNVTILLLYITEKNAGFLQIIRDFLGI